MKDTYSLQELKDEYGQYLYRWEVPKEMQEGKRVSDDLAKSYVVFEDKKCQGGIIVYAEWDRGFVVNPWSTRHLIKNLIHIIYTLNDYEIKHWYNDQFAIEDSNGDTYFYGSENECKGVLKVMNNQILEELASR